MGFAKTESLTKAQVKKLMLEDLKRSGIGELPAKANNLEPLTAEETYKITNTFSVPSYRIPYTTNSKFFRLRFLEEVQVGKKVQRYWQPTGTLPSVYLPDLPKQPKWETVIHDAGHSVYITEGEKKAISGCQHGYTVLGIGGVWAWRAAKWNLDLIPELELFAWEGREVTLVFDSDIVDKKEVQEALAALARTLATLGAIVWQAYLPRNTKGLDDYLVANGAIEDLERTQVFSHLEELNSDFVYVQSDQKVLALADLRSGHLNRMCPRSEATEHYARHTQAPHFKEWNRWVRRHEVGGFTYRPGYDHFSVEFPDQANIWVAPTLEPKKGRIRPWLQFMRYMTAQEPTALEYIQWWLAMTVARPEIKVRTSIVLWSEAQGTGKTLCFELMRPLVGAQNYGVPNLNSVASNFNAWVEGKKLLVLNEAYDSADRNISNALKDLQTSDLIEINAKYRAPYHIPNYVHLAVTSNKPTPVYITKADRRHYVCRTPDHRLEVDDYNKLLAWWKAGGASHVFHHMRENVDLEQFDPNSEPPETISKQDMVEANYTEAERLITNEHWAKDWARKCDLFEMSQLMSYVHAVNPKITETQVRNALHRLGARHERLRIRNVIVYLWAVRNFEHWTKVTAKAMREHAMQYNESFTSASATRRRLRSRK